MSETKACYATRTRRGGTLKDGSISERAFTDQVMRFARMHGWLAYHTWQAIHSPKGFLDCVFVRPATYQVKSEFEPRLIFAELKSTRGKLSAEQEEWLGALRAARKCVYIWRPTDECWREIEEVLGNG